MKIGPKLAICFVGMVVVPLLVTSWIYARSSADLGRDMADRGKQLLISRITEDLNRARDLSIATLTQTKDELLGETVRNAAEIARQLMTTPDAEAILGAQRAPFAAEAAEDSARGINLERSNIRFESDADPLEAPQVLARLQGLGDVARTSFLRNQATVRANSIALEVGVTGWYPGGSEIEANDHRERDWYLTTLEQLTPQWFASDADRFQELFAVAPLITSDGQVAGVLRTIVPIKKLLDSTVPIASIPTNASAYLIVVPDDHPNLFPHVIGSLSPESTDWEVSDGIDALDFEGDDAWLKLLSDVRSGVDGLEFVTRGTSEEVWSFKPLAKVVGGELHFAVAQPQSVVTVAEAQADVAVGAAISKQVRNTTIVAIVAGLVAIFVALAAAKTLTGPIRQLHQAARKLARGDFSVRVKNKSRNEIGELSSDFNAMVPALEERLKVKRDLDMAREIQQFLVERAAPSLEGFDIAGQTIYCDETGGDYQDFIDIHDGKNNVKGLAAVIGDVTGHGVGAALLMAAARSSLRAHMRHENNVRKLMEAVNTDISADSSGGRFLTMFFALLRPGSGKVSWISAGHEVALIFDPATDTFTELDGEDIPLGVDVTWTYTLADADIPKGGLLVAYTDGVREAINAAGERYGMDRLKASIRAAHARGSYTISEQIIADWRNYCGDVSPNDDVSLMVIKSTN